MSLFSPVVVPGRRLGSIEVGSQISQVSKILRDDAMTFRNVVVDFDPVNFESDILFDLTSNGVHLRFDPINQRLKMIEVYDLKSLSIFYSGTACCGPSVIPSFRSIYNLFGPTYPGNYDKTLKVFWLSYPGIAFSFPMPQEVAQMFSDATELPKVLPDGTVPTATCIRIMHGIEYLDPVLPPLTTALQNVMEIVRLEMNKGATWSNRRRFIGFQSSTQDVMTELGTPADVYAKRNDKVRIHDVGGGSSDVLVPDVFFNYPEVGVDILFDGRSHLAKKFVFYTNHPLDPDFNTNNKCNFSLALRGGVVTPESTWASIKALFGGESGRPAVHDASEKALPTADGVVFAPHASDHAATDVGSSLFFGYPGVVFHVTKTGALLSLTMFNDPYAPS